MGGCLRPLELGLGAPDLHDSGSDTEDSGTDTGTDTDPADSGDDDAVVPDGSPNLFVTKDA
jgi:hypothetical protein